MKTSFTCVATSMVLLASVPASGSEDFPRGNPYGEQRPYGRHPGIDFMVDVGTPVIAPADGKVTEIRSFDGPRPWQGGWVVQVTHAEDFHSAYLHLTELHVEMGKSVKRGQLIGLSGASNSGHAHLHFGACAMSAGRANLDRAGAGDEEAGVIRPKGLTVRPVTLNSAAPRWRFWDSALGELIRESTGLEK